MLCTKFTRNGPMTKDHRSLFLLAHPGLGHSALVFKHDHLATDQNSDLIRFHALGQAIICQWSAVTVVHMKHGFLTELMPLLQHRAAHKKPSGHLTRHSPQSISSLSCALERIALCLQSCSADTLHCARRKWNHMKLVITCGNPTAIREVMDPSLLGLVSSLSSKWCITEGHNRKVLPVQPLGSESQFESICCNASSTTRFASFKLSTLPLGLQARWSSFTLYARCGRPYRLIHARLPTTLRRLVNSSGDRRSVPFLPWPMVTVLSDLAFSWTSTWMVKSSSWVKRRPQYRKFFSSIFPTENRPKISCTFFLPTSLWQKRRPSTCAQIMASKVPSSLRKKYVAGATWLATNLACLISLSIRR